MHIYIYIYLIGISKYIKDGYYDISNDKWLKYIDNDSYINVWLRNIGKANDTVKLVAQWEKLDDNSSDVEYDKIPNIDDILGNVDKNQQTGNIAVFITIFIGIFTLGCSLYYIRKKNK